MIVLTEKIWTQVDGDMDPATYGGVIARLDGDAIELMEIQPVREYVGNREAIDVGFPFWTKEAYYTPQDLTTDCREYKYALSFVGQDHESMMQYDERDQCIILSVAYLQYGYQTSEGPCGFAKDILGDMRVRWYRSERPQGWRYLADEDAEFRRLMKEEKVYG